MRSTTALIVVSMLGLNATTWATDKEYQQNFRDRAFDFQRLQLLGVNAQRHVTPEPGGLRMVLPGNKKIPLVGITPRFRVRGDFEITAEFVINKVGKPSGGYGVGVTIYLLAETEGQEVASMGRLHRVREGEVFAAMHGITPPDGQRKHNVKLVPTQAKFGKLRIARTDATLRYLYAEENSPDFKELFQAQFTHADIIQVRLGADSGGTDSTLDIFWKNLSINAKAFPDLHEVRSWRLYYIFGFILAGGLVAWGVWKWLRIKSQAKNQDAA